MNLKINIVAVLLNLIFLCSLFINQPAKRLPHSLISTGLLTSVFIFGIALWDVIYESNNLFRFTKGSYGEWYVRFAPSFIIMVSAVVLIIFSGIILISRSQSLLTISFDRPRSSYHSQVFIGCIIFATILIIGLISFRDRINEKIADYIDFISTVLLAFGGVAILTEILANPITSLFLKKEPKFLINKKLIGWALFCTKDDGPTLIKSELTVLDHYTIPYPKLLQFGIQSIMFSHTDGKIIESVSITPFIGENEITSISLSFSHIDKNLKDRRLNHQSQSILLIFIPSFILAAFSHPIGRLHQLNEIMMKYKQKTKDIDEFTETKNIEDLVYEILKEVY